MSRKSRKQVLSEAISPSWKGKRLWPTLFGLKREDLISSLATKIWFNLAKWDLMTKSNFILFAIFGPVLEHVVPATYLPRGYSFESPITAVAAASGATTWVSIRLRLAIGIMVEENKKSPKLKFGMRCILWIICEKNLIVICNQCKSNSSSEVLIQLKAFTTTMILYDTWCTRLYEKIWNTNMRSFWFK